MFVRKKKIKVEAHICIASFAYKVFKELERQLKVLQSDLSSEKVIEIACTIYAIHATKPLSYEVVDQILILTEAQSQLVKLFNL